MHFDQHFDAIRNYLYYRSANAELASDLAQESFMRIWEKRKVFKQTQLKALLYKIAGQLLIDHYRKEKTAQNYLEQIQLDWSTSNTEEHLAYQELKKEYEAALAKLTEKQRVTFLMSRMDGLSYKEIAQRLSIGLKAVEKRMSKALETLKEEISAYDAI